MSALQDKKPNWVERVDALESADFIDGWQKWDLMKDLLVEIRQCHHALIIKPLLGSGDEADLHLHLSLLHDTDDALLKDEQRIQPIRSLASALDEAVAKAEVKERQRKGGASGGKKSKGPAAAQDRKEAIQDDYSIRKSEFKSISEYHEQIDARWTDWCKERGLPETTTPISLRTCQRYLES